MDWSNERYVRIYTRETISDAALPWEARALWHEMLKKFDRAGIIDLQSHGLAGLAGLVRIPIDVVERCFPLLERDGRVVKHEDQLVAPNFLEAQEAPQSDRMRQAESRARRRDVAMLNVTKRDNMESQNVTECHERSHGVTNGHTASRDVTPDQPSQTSQTSQTTLDFESVYQQYPRKKSKKVGMASARRLVRTQADFDLLSNVVSEMARAWSGHDLTYCPHWSTFISQERWRDDELPLPSADKPQRKAEPNCELPWLEVGE